MNDMPEYYCGRIKAVHLQYINGGAITKLCPKGVWGHCMDYVPTYQVHMVKNTTQQQLQSSL